MTITRTRTIAFLLLLLAAQVLACLHGVAHVGGPDEQACSQCLHGKVKQHALASGPVPAAPAADVPALHRHLVSIAGTDTPGACRPRAPPLAT